MFRHLLTYLPTSGLASMYRTMTSSISIFFRTCPMSQPCIGGFVLSEKLHMVVLRGYTPKPWLYVLVHGYTNLSSPYVSTSYQEKPRGGYVSHTVVIRLISWLCVVIHGYILQM